VTVADLNVSQAYGRGEVFYPHLPG
jgi:hypothetical protein